MYQKVTLLLFISKPHISDVTSGSHKRATHQGNHEAYQAIDQFHQHEQNNPPVKKQKYRSEPAIHWV